MLHSGGIVTMQPQAQVRRGRRPVPPIEQRDWLKASELRDIVGMSVSTIDRHVRGELQPKLGFRAVGKSRRVFSKAMVQAWLSDLERRSVAE